MKIDSLSSSPTLLLEANDVAKCLNVGPQMVGKLAKNGKLKVAAKTPRGTRLFLPQDVEALRIERENNPPRPGPRKRRRAA